MDKNKLAVDVFDKRSGEYQDKYMNVGLYGDTFDLFCSHLKKNAEVLELACGPGNITQYLLKKRPDLKILGTDLAPNMIRLAQLNNPTAKFKLLDARQISELGKKYKAIMCGFCLPYLSKEEAVKLIADAANILTSGGLIYLSTMEDNYDKSGLQSSSQGDQLFLYYHEATYLKKALEEHKFKILNETRKEYVQSGSKITDLILIAQI